MNKECCICLEKISNNNKITCPHCKQTYHDECVNKIKQFNLTKCNQCK